MSVGTEAVTFLKEVIQIGPGLEIIRSSLASSSVTAKSKRCLLPRTAERRSSNTPSPHPRGFDVLYGRVTGLCHAALTGRPRVIIRKEKGRPLGRDHINGIEGFWSYAKNWLYPYRSVPRKLFHLYLGGSLLPIQPSQRRPETPVIEAHAYNQHG